MRTNRLSCTLRFTPSPDASAVLPLQCERLHHRLQHVELLSPFLRHAAQRRLASLSDADARRLCHGDLHPGNVLLPAQGKPVIIDWCDSAYGDADADAARTLMLLRVGKVSQSGSNTASLDVKRDVFCPAYQERYCQLRFLQRESIDRWIPVIAAAHLDETMMPAEQERRLSIAQTAFLRTGN